MASLLFKRSTHDEYGNYKNDPNFDLISYDLDYTHILDSDKFISIYEVRDRVEQYNEIYPDAPYVSDMRNIAFGLVRMCELGLATAIQE